MSELDQKPWEKYIPAPTAGADLKPWEKYAPAVEKKSPNGNDLSNGSETSGQPSSPSRPPFNDFLKNLQNYRAPKPKKEYVVHPEMQKILDDAHKNSGSQNDFVTKAISTTLNKAAEFIPQRVKNAWDKGQLQGELANIVPVNGELNDDVARQIVAYETASNQIPITPEAQKLDEEGVLWAFKHPVQGAKALGETIISSLSAQIKASERTSPAAVAIGAGAGSVVPGVGTLAGAATGLTAGQLVAGLNLESSSTFLQVLKDAGFPTNSEEKLREAFSDPKLIDKARSMGIKRGIPILVFDMLSAGIGGKLAAGTMRSALKPLAVAGVEAAGGSAGELAAQVTAGQQIDPNAIALEGIAELGAGAPALATEYVSRKKTSSSNENIVKQIATDKETGTVEAKANLDRNLKDGLISPDEHTEGVEYVDKVIAVDDKIPAKVTGENREKSIELVSEKETAVAELEDLKKEKKNTDDAYHAPIEGKIERREEKIKTINKELTELAKGEQQDAIQEPGAASVLQHSQEGVGETGSERSGVEPIEQGVEITQESIGEEIPQSTQEEIAPLDIERFSYEEETPVAVKESTTDLFKVGDSDTFYHASPKKRVGRLTPGSAPQFGEGVYFSTNRDLVIDEFGNEVTEVKIDAKKPLYTGSKEERAVKELAAENWNRENLTYEPENERYVNKEGKETMPVEFGDLGERLPVKYYSDAAKQLGYDVIVDEGSSTYDNEIVVLDESKIQYPEETVTAEQVRTKADTDLASLKQATDKPKKYEASMKRLTEAKNAKLITPKEFDAYKQKFDDVIGADKKAGDVLRKLADKIDQGKIAKPGQLMASSGFDAVWDGSLSAVSASLRAGATVADAIEAGLKQIRQTDWYKNLSDKNKFENAYTSHMTGQLVDKNRTSTKSPSGQSSDFKSISNSLVLDAEKVSDLFKSTAFKSQGFSGLDAPSRAVVRDLMHAIGSNKEILNSVVKFIPVNVMDMLRAEKLSPEMLFHDETVLSKFLSPNTDKSVSVVADAANSIIRAITSATTEESSSVLGNLPSGSTGNSAAIGTGNVDTHDTNITNKTKPNKTQESKQEPSEDRATKKRAATKRVLESDKYGQDFKDAITEKTIYYKELPNQVTEAEAEALLDIEGEDGAIKATSDFNNGMPSAVRFSVLQKLIDRMEERGDHLQAAELAEDLYSKATDYGQGIQIFSTFPKLSKAANVAYARKTVQTQRDKLAKRAKPTTDKVAKEFKKANKEAAEETVEAVKKSVERVTKVTSGTITDLPAGYGTKNKVFTRDKYLKAKQNLRSALHSFAGGVPIEDLVNIAGYHIEATGRDFERFTRRMKADLGAKVKPYLKDIYGRAREALVQEGYDAKLFLTDAQIDEHINAQEGEVFKNKLEKAIAKKSAKDQKQAIAKLQQISKDEGLWGQYSDSASKRLKSMVKTNIQTDIEGSPSLQQFTDGLVKNMRQKMAEEMPEAPKRVSNPRPDIEVIADAYKNVEKYKEVWEKTQAEFREKFADDPDILESIDAYFGEILEKPFSERALESAVRKGLKDMDKTIADLVVQHYTVVDHTKESLRDKLVNEAGLSETDASSLAREIERKFDEIATKKKQQILNRMFSNKTRKANAQRGVDTELIKLTNLGGFSNAEIVEAYGEKMGWPKLTQENIQQLELLSDIIQNTKDPINKRRATEDLLSYQAGLKGLSPLDTVTAVWYANMLSGYNTQLINFGANAINTVLLYANAVAQNPGNARFIGHGLLEGLKRGWLEGKDTFKTGYSPIKGRPEIPPLLERVTFKGGDWNPGNYLKYVRRLMVAADVLFFEGQKEMRAYQLAKKQAMREGKENPSLNQVDRAIELVGKSSGQIEAIQQKYESEFNEDVERIKAQEDLSESEKTDLIKSMEGDKQRKIFDAIEQGRTGEMIEEGVRYASEGTYNYPPKGLLGGVAKGINAIIDDVPLLRYAVPFTNIIANVANETINYSPIAFTRLKKGGWSNFRREELTPQQRADLMTKAIIGTGLMATAMALSQPSGDDDEPLLEITANGTGDYAKNETLKQTGWQPYSFRMKLPTGNYTPWYSYQYSPLVFSLGYVGHFNDLHKYKKEDSADGISARLSKAAGLSTSSFFETTYLNGLGDILNTALDPRASEGMMDKVAKGGANAARSLLIPNLYTQAAQDMERIFDVNKKETRDGSETPLDYTKSLMARTVQDIPFARNMFYDKVNIIGDPIKYDTDKFESSATPNPVIELLVDKKAVFPAPNRNAEKIYDIEKGAERALTDAEFYQYAKQKGAYIKKALSDKLEAYQKMPEEKFKKELTQIKTEANNYAKSIIGNIPSSTMQIKEEDVTYKLSPAQIKKRIALNKEYVESHQSDLIQDTENYIQDGIPPAKAREMARKGIESEANSNSKDVLMSDPDFKKEAIAE